MRSIKALLIIATGIIGLSSNPGWAIVKDVTTKPVVNNDTVTNNKISTKPSEHDKKTYEKALQNEQEIQGVYLKHPTFPGL
jgi:hypothetical protein